MRVLRVIGEKLLMAAFVAAFLWLEFGGVWHAFAHYGVSDGLTAACVPPYAWYRSVQFFWWDEGDITAADEEGLRHCSKSIDLHNQSKVFLKKEAAGKTQVVLSKTQVDELLDLHRQTLEESEKVSDVVLLKLHPDMLRHYREEFCEGVRLVIRSYETVRSNLELGLSLGIRGNLLLEEFGDWYIAHRDEMRAKLSR